MKYTQHDPIPNHTGVHQDKAVRQAFNWVPTTTVRDVATKSLQGKTNLGQLEKLKWENAGAGTSNSTSWADEIDRYQRDVGKVSKIQDVIPARGKQGAVYGLTMRDFWDKRLGNEYTGVPIQHAGKDTESSIQNLPFGICGNDEPLHEGAKIRHAGMDTKSSVDFTWGKDVQDSQPFDQVYSLAHTEKDSASNIELYYTPGKTPPNTKGKRIHKTKHKSQSQLHFTQGGMMGEGTDMAFDAVYGMAHADKDTFSHMKTFGDEGEATLAEIGLHKLYASEHSHLDTYSQIVFGNEKTLSESPPPRIVHGRRVRFEKTSPDAFGKVGLLQVNHQDAILQHTGNSHQEVCTLNVDTISKRGRGLRSQMRNKRDKVHFDWTA